jgi:hypothetical protein
MLTRGAAGGRRGSAKELSNAAVQQCSSASLLCHLADGTVGHWSVTRGKPLNRYDLACPPEGPQVRKHSG